MTSKRLVELSIIKFVKKNESQVTFQSLNLPRTKVIIDLDASFNISIMEIIKGGDIFMLTDKNRRSYPISWISNKVKIVARFT